MKIMNHSTSATFPAPTLLVSLSVSLLLAILLPITPLAAANWLFVLFDAGETNGLVPVIQLLQSMESEKVFVMAEGASVSILKRRNITPLRLADFARDGMLNLQVPADKLAFDHNAGPFISLRHVSVKEIPQQVFDKIHPHALITGLVSQYESDFLQAAKKAGVPSFGFFDFYDVPGKGSIFVRLCPEADRIMVSTPEIAIGMAQAGIMDEKRIMVTGHPNFSGLCDLKASFDRKTVLKSAGFDPDKQYFTFTTQYSTRNDELLTLLARVMKSMSLKKTAVADEAPELIIAPHPNQDPDHYRTLAQDFGIPYHILDRSKISVYQAMLASDMVFTESSTTGFEAILLDRPLVHILLPGSDPVNQFNVRRGLALWATTETELHEAINALAGDKGRQIGEKRALVRPLPDAAKAIVDGVLKVMKIPTLR
ncbi:MAG: hypothetical protein CVV64_12620 [Candidatus Wallbacteria bacterium HGW-Wallbacteria-1]|jgi:hypothetical protein|uniref:UDP-N-acetylglucosamine 2-epimerase domain-containing protein n=1 Tax=Candidatus Wallbacteria bacterium HGW-Wallbacteria-1 TaxID=2013854 RepID=A0A2N1PN55_9BACT|nr:MAG: hypothetical protein CVV64_12620 [Candidatus Wallbacteria bacterium HGW-Wallbacteria-1]